MLLIRVVEGINFIRCRSIWATFKTLVTFHYTGWLIGVSIMQYYKPWIDGQHNPQYTANNPKVLVAAHNTAQSPSKWLSKSDDKWVICSESTCLSRRFSKRRWPFPGFPQEDGSLFYDQIFGSQQMVMKGMVHSWKMNHVFFQCYQQFLEPATQSTVFTCWLKHLHQENQKYVQNQGSWQCL